MDTEIVAIDSANGEIKTFQELSNRARKDVKLDEVLVPVCVFAFDIMYLDGEVSFTVRLSRYYLFWLPASDIIRETIP